MMKILRLLFLLVLSTSFALGQNNVRVNIIVPPPYPDYLSYYRDQGRMIITLQNLTNTQQEIYLRGSIKGIDNNREIHTKPEFRPNRSIIIPAGVGQTVTVSSADIQDLYKSANLNFYNTDASRISAADRVGEGTYSICVRAYDYKAPTRPLSADQTGCTTIMMRNLEAPMLIQPLNDAQIKNTGIQNVLFSWTQPAGTPIGTSYMLKIVEIFTPDRNPNDAYLSATSPAFFEKEIPTNVYVYGPSDPALVEGRKYAWAITALDPDRARYGRNTQSMFQNEGRSEIHSFTFTKGILSPVAQINLPIQTPAVVVNKSEVVPPPIVLPTNQMTIKSAPLDQVVCECKSPVPQGTSSPLNVQDEVKVNTFTLKVLNIENHADGRYTGTGTIPVPLLNNSYVRIRVKFREMEVVNTGGEKRMLSGTVKAIRRADMSILPSADTPSLEPAPLSTGNIHEIGSFFEQQKDQLLSSIKNSANSAGFELPIGLDEGPVTIGITEMNFTPTQAWFNAVASMAIPDGNTKAAFEMSGACMQRTDFCGQFKLRLKEELNIPSIGMRLVPGDLQGEGTYIVFQKKFLELALAIDYTFPGGILNAQNHQNAVARMSARTTEGWKNWIAKVALPDFYITGLPTITFSLGDKSIWYDHSDLFNPDNLPASIRVGNETYTDIGAKTWHGFYIPELSVVLPAIIKDVRRPDDKLAISAYQLVIDRNGFTGTVKNTTNPVIGVGDGSLQGWYASVDEVNLQFFKSGFRESSMRGKVVLPGTGDHKVSANQLQYTSLLSYSSGEGLKYSFNISPKNNLNFNVLFATATITDNSTISVSAGGNQGFYAHTNLHGHITINNIKALDDSPISLSLPGLKLENFKLQTKAPYWDKEGFVLGFASEQKTMAGFNYTINKPTVDVSIQNDGSVLAGLEFSGLISLIDEGFTAQAAGSATIGSVFTMENHRIKWGGLGGKINEIKFAAGTSMGPFTLEGAIMYYNRNGDEGFVGALQSGVSGMFSVMMRAQFGSTKDNRGSYKYFNFNALADFGQTGIPIAPPIPISFYGFGGGFYYNMSLNNAAMFSSNEAKTKVQGADNQEPPKNEMGPIALLNYNPAGIQLAPNRGSFGLQATVLLGLTSRNTLDADVTLSMGFTASGGVEYVDFTGNVRVLTDVSKPIATRRNSSTGAGTITIHYNFQEKSFLTSIRAELGVPNVNDGKWIYAKGYLEIASDSEGWHVYAGRPPGNGEGPNSVNFLRKDLIGGSATEYIFTGYTYFEVGSRVDNIPDIPQEIKDLVGMGQNDQQGNLRRPGAAPGRGKYSATTGGLIVGAHTKFHFGGSFLMFFGELSSMSGFDIAIKNEAQCVNLPNAGGPGNWYAMGQAYFGAKAKIGIEVNLLLIKGRFTIFDAGAAAVIRAGLPNPTWVDGYVGGYFNILDGAIKGKFNFHVSVGEQCKVLGDPLAGLEIISEITPASTQELQPINTEPSVLFNLQVGKVFVLEDMTNIDSKGNPKTRVFKFDLECIDATVNGQKINLKSTGQGEDANLLYTVPATQINGGASDYLSKNTQYDFKVVAYMKEAPFVLKNGRVDIGEFKFVSKEMGKLLEPSANKNRRASQTLASRFKTNDGFDHIPEGDYKETAPLHGRRALPYAYNEDLNIRLNKYLSPAENIRGVTAEAKLFLRIFRNGVKVGADLPVTMTRGERGGKYTLFDAGKVNFAMLPSSKYVGLLVAKNPVQTSTQGLVRTEISGTSTNISAANLAQFNEVRLTKMSGPKRNVLSNGEIIIGGYDFQTSQFRLFKDKFDNLKVTDLRDNRPPSSESQTSATPWANPTANSPFSGRTIAENTPQATSLAILNAWLPKDAQGNYVISVGRFTNFYALANFKGERFSKADEKHSIAGMMMFADINRQNISFNWLDQVIAFLSKKTGVPVARFTFHDSSALQEVGIECSTHSDTEAKFINPSAVGGVHPVDLPQAGTTVAMLNSSAMQNFNFNTNFSPVDLMFGGTRAVQFQQSETIRRCRDYVALSASNIVQERINEVINSRVNPADQWMSTLNNAATWQGISQAINSFGKGLNSNQLKQQVGTAVNR